MVRTPKRVARVSMLYLRSPSTSGRSFVMAMTVAKTVTKHVTNLHEQAPKLLTHTQKPSCAESLGTSASTLYHLAHSCGYK